MGLDAIRQILGRLGVSADDFAPGHRLRAELALDSGQTTELEVELADGYAVRVDLWDTHDYSIGELAALIDAAEVRR